MNTRSRSLFRVNVSDFWGFVLFVILIIVMGGNSENLDYRNYELTYEYLKHMKGIEFGYYALQRLGKDLGLNFRLFKLLITIICMSIVRISLKQYHFKTSWFYCLYFLYPFFLDTIEIRNFIGVTILVASMRYLRNPEKRSKLYFTALIVLATLFHSIFIVFLPLAFLDKLDSDKGKRWILGLAVALSIIMMFLPGLVIALINAFWERLAATGVAETRSSYTETVQTRFGFILFFVKQVICFVTSYYEVRLLSSIESPEEPERSFFAKTNIIRIVYFLNIYAFLFCPIYRINSQFSRIMQNISILSHIAFLSSMSLSKGVRSTDKSIVKILYISYVTYTSVSVLIIQHMQDIIVPILSNNWIWG